MSEHLREFDGLEPTASNENNAEENKDEPEDNEENYNTTGQDDYYEQAEDDDEDEDDEDDEDDETDTYQNPFYLPAELLNSTKSKSDLNNLMNQDDGLVEEDVGVISALAPKMSQQDDVQVEISSTPAFQCLEELFQNGKLTGTQVAQLKAKYIELHTTLKKSRENEARLLRECKDSIKKLEENNEVMQRADTYTDNITNEGLKLRNDLLKIENDINCREERLYNLEYKLAGLEDDKELIDREYARMPKPHELEKRIEQLKMQNMDFARDIQQYQEEVKELRLNISNKAVVLESKRNELKQHLEEIENKKNEYVKIAASPNQTNKEVDKILTEIEQTKKEETSVDIEIKAINARIEEINKLNEEAERRRDELMHEIEHNRKESYGKEKEVNDLIKQYELEKEKEVTLQSDKVTLDVCLKHTLADKKLEYDTLIRTQKDLEKENKNLKKRELQLRACQDSVVNLRMQYEKIKSQIDKQPLNDSTFKERYNELKKEVEQMKSELNKEHSITNIEKVKVEMRIEAEEQLLCKQSEFRIQAVEVTRLAAIKADEKEQKLREFMKAETRYKQVLEDLKIKENQIDEHAKRLRDFKIKLKDFAKMYNVIKNERNKCVNQIQICTQRAAEMKEKIKILGNETEILRTASTQKEKQLKKQRLRFANLVALRDSIRNEVAKQKFLLEDMKNVQEQQQMNINNYNNLLNYNEQESTRLRKRYEECVKERNARGILLITRSEEVCVIFERVNAQDSIIKNGNIELQAREEESKFLALRVEEEKRQLALSRKNAPNAQACEKELELFRKQLIDCQNYQFELEKKVEDCNNPERIRLLEKPEETADDIMRKLEKLEIKLTKTEEQCLEKDLILEQVNRLADRLSKKVDTSKDDTLNLAKQVNQIQSQIKDTTKKMMAKVSELSISQAAALKLQEEVKTKELLLEQYYNRMQKGEAPSEEIERDWLRSIDLQDKLKNKQVVSQPDDKVVYTMPDGYVTTAEPRPNAYIPQNENELPLPRPYGRLAPFKPQDPGSTMRHIKKPNPKPIEI